MGSGRWTGIENRYSTRREVKTRGGSLILSTPLRLNPISATKGSGGDCKGGILGLRAGIDDDMKTMMRKRSEGEGDSETRDYTEVVFFNGLDKGIWR